MKKVLSRKAVLTKGALMAYLVPKLAADASITLTPMLDGLSFKNFKERQPALLKALQAAVEGKLAKDANIGDLTGLLDALGNQQEPEGADVDPNSGLPMEKEAMDDDMGAKVLAFLQGKLSPEDLAAVQKMCAGPGAADEPPPFKGKPKVGGGGPDAEDEEEDGVTQAAMDAAIAATAKSTAASTEAAVVKRMQGIRDAERAVRPYVGELEVAFDSADGVYKHALTALGVKVDGVHPSAYPALLEMVPKPGAKPASRKEPLLSMDAAAAKTYDEMFPGASAIRVQ